MNTFPEYGERPRVQLEQFTPAPPPPPPSRRRRALRAAAATAAAVAGLVILAGAGWTVADALWARGDAAPGVLPNTFPTATPQSPVPQRIKPVEQAPVPREQREALFLSVVRADHPAASALTDSDLIGLADAACGVLDAGGTKEMLLTALLIQQSDAETSRMLSAVMGAGVGALCPEHSPKLR